MSPLSLLSWNVKMFDLKKTLKERVVEHIKNQNPDVFAILEVLGADVWEHMYREFPNHSFYITEGEQTQQILVAVRKDFKFFITQRDEFKNGITSLRPGPFLTIEYNNEYYTILFLHVKSFSTPEGFGLRDNMIEHAFNFKKQLDKVGCNGNAKFLFMGDLNTMGMNLTYLDGDVTDLAEIKRLESRANYRKMLVLPKDHDQTYTSGIMYSNLDHVVASSAIKFKSWNGKNVKVLGWNQFTPDSPEFNEFINKISDHCSIYCEIE